MSCSRRSGSHGSGGTEPQKTGPLIGKRFKLTGPGLEAYNAYEELDLGKQLGKPVGEV